MRRNIHFYRTDYTKFTSTNLIPKFSFSKNVQGWVFTRNYTFECMRYAITLSLLITSDTKIPMNIAHRDNVNKWMLNKQD
jgi:hypothetical protein